MCSFTVSSRVTVLAGNFFVTRLPVDAQADLDDETGPDVGTPAGSILLKGAEHKMKTIVNFHLGDIVSSCAMSAFVMLTVA